MNEQVAVLLAASRTVYVTVVIPTLNVWVPTLLIPVAGEEAVVAPVIAQVSMVTPQLSPVVALGTAMLRLQTPAVAGCEMLAGQEIVGSCASVTVTVNEQVAELLAASRTV